MALYQITWIDKPGGSQNPRTRIERVGGSDWGDTATAVINAINNRTHQFFVSNGGSRISVGVSYREGVPYLKTDNDGTPLDNLLYLPNVSNVR